MSLCEHRTARVPHWGWGPIFLPPTHPGCWPSPIAGRGVLSLYCDLVQHTTQPARIGRKSKFKFARKPEIASTTSKQSQETPNVRTQRTNAAKAIPEPPAVHDSAEKIWTCYRKRFCPVLRTTPPTRRHFDYSMPPQSPGNLKICVVNPPQFLCVFVLFCSLRVLPGF